MEISTALRLLELPLEPTRAQVQSAYRKLVKRYHPDHNPRRPEWAHTMMTRLLEAHTVAIGFADSIPATTAGAAAGKRAAGFTEATGRPSHYSRPEQHTRPRFEESPQRQAAMSSRNRRYTAALASCNRNLLDALHYFFVHGLEKGHLRATGSQHIRYRRALRKIDSVVTEIGDLALPAGESRLTAARRDLLEFAMAFRECASAPVVPRTQAAMGNYAVYRHLARGIELLDALIRSCLFPDLRSSDLPPGATSTLSFHELMLVINSPAGHPWAEEAAMRLRLLEAFQSHQVSYRALLT